MGNSGSTSAKRQAARHAREERKREFEREQEHETRLALERDELLARIRALLDENNIFDPLTDDDRAALARQCRRCVALPGERVLQWRTKRERAVTRQARDAAEAERELERERAGQAPLRDEDYEFDPDTALYVVAEGAVEIIIHHDDDDDEEEEEAKNTAVRRLKDQTRSCVPYAAGDASASSSGSSGWVPTSAPPSSPSTRTPTSHRTIPPVRRKPR